MNISDWIMLSIFLLFAMIISLFFIKIVKELRKLQKVNQQLIHRLEENQEAIIAYQHNKENELQEEWRSYVYLQLLTIRNAVNKQTSDIYLTDIEEAPKNSVLSDKEMSSAFTPEQLIIINEYFGLFNHYIEKHWLTNDGKFKAIFRGNKDQKGSEVATLILESKGLVKKLDKLLRQLKES